MKSTAEKRQNWRSWVFGTLIAVWAVFTISLISWWYIFSQQQITKLRLAHGALAEELVRNQKMLMWEGGALIVSLLIGASALIYFVVTDRKRSSNLVQFFLTFTHELKTPIATLRLYAETLQEKLEGTEHSKLGQQLIQEADRLSLQLENSLTLAQIGDARFYTETLSLKELLRPLRSEFEKVDISLSEDAKVFADSQALTTILRNVLKNAASHGGANEMQITTDFADEPMVRITFQDNGEGLKGNPKLLGKKFQRLYRGSGTGIGLYLCRELAEKMGGSLSFPKATAKGFSVLLTLPAREEGS